MSAVLLLWALAVQAPVPAAAPAHFALILGVNQSPSPDLKPLRYADDDAARYRDLFRTLGARTFLLSTLDDNTRRLHPEAAAEAQPARRATLEATVTALAAEVDAARRAGRATSLHVLYAGHGGEEDGLGYVTLEDGRLRGAELLEQVFDRVKADGNHLVVDACSAFLLVQGRGGDQGPGHGGVRRPLRGFARSGPGLLERADIGLLLSTSSAAESHEWAAFQAGVFSHEVRSGLFGAADANGDGLITYDEIRAFIQRANESIPNERYRPQIFWRAPAGQHALLDLRAALDRRVEVRASEGGHHFLEDAQGVRLADFHNGRSMTVRLLRPRAATGDHLYLQRVRDGREYVLPDGVAVLSTATLPTQDAHVASRSAAHDAFFGLFALPLEATGDRGPAAAAGLEASAAPAPVRWTGRRITGWTLVAGSALAAAVSAELLVSARALTSRPRDAAGANVASINDRRRTYDRWTLATAGLATAAAVAGVTVLLWPDAPLELQAGPHVAALSFHSRF
jgi:hypothetical protein